MGRVLATDLHLLGSFLGLQEGHATVTGVEGGFACMPLWNPLLSTSLSSPR